HRSQRVSTRAQALHETTLPTSLSEYAPKNILHSLTAKCPVEEHKRILVIVTNVDHYNTLLIAERCAALSQPCVFARLTQLTRTRRHRYHVQRFIHSRRIEPMYSKNLTPQEIFQIRLFEEPLVPVGAEPTQSENAALVTALLDYSKRASPDDFSSLNGFLEAYPTCPWNVSLLTNLGLEYYHTGHYSKTLEVWGKAWELGKAATDARGRAIANRALGELAYMHARLGQMMELQALLYSVEGRTFSGPATERIAGAREGLWNMENRPEIAFRCGPLALHRIKVSLDPTNPGTALIHACASTEKGFSLLQIEELSRELGLYYQMAFR